MAVLEIMRLIGNLLVRSHDPDLFGCGHARTPVLAFKLRRLRAPPRRRRNALVRGVNNGLIPSPIDQNPWAHWRNPRDMTRHGWSTSLFQASQQWSTRSS